jgi:hypothetical protein
MTKDMKDILVQIEMLFMDYENARTRLADRTREHDLLKLQTRQNIESLKTYYEEQGMKSTQAKSKAEKEEEINLKNLIDLEHEQNTLKAECDVMEYKFSFLFREYDRLLYDEGEDTV